VTDDRAATPDNAASSGADNATPAAETNETALQELYSRLEQLEAQAAEYKDQWLRSVAEFKNFKRRADTERSELQRSAGASILLKVLPVVDDFERAIAAIPAEIAESSWWGGTQLIANKLRLLLESEGVKPIEALDQPFDPNLHEAVLYEDAPGKDGIVTAEFQRGYRLHDRVIRPAMVKVGKDA
jgi:molecular chaperone GrpE